MKCLLEVEVVLLNELVEPKHHMLLLMPFLENRLYFINI
jgi:hypothetical protein